MSVLMFSCPTGGAPFPLVVVILANGLESMDGWMKGQ